MLKEYAIQVGIEMVWVINYPDRLLYRCRGEGCQWVIKARETIFGQSMKVYEYSKEHTYHKLSNNPEARVRFIVRKIEDLIRKCPHIEYDTLSQLL